MPNMVKKEERFRLIIILLIFGGCLFFWQYGIVRFLMSHFYFEQGRNLNEKASAIPDAYLAKKAVLYKRSLLSIIHSLKLTPFNPQLLVAYADMLSAIAEDPYLCKIIELESGGIKTKDNLGFFYEKAQRLYRKAVFFEPTNPEYHLKLATVYDKLGKTQKAQEELSRAAALGANNATVYLFIVRYYLAKGDEVKFNYYLEEMIKIGNRLGLCGGGPMADIVLPFLKEIGKEGMLKR